MDIKKKYKKKITEQLLKLDDTAYNSDFIKHVLEKNQEITNCLKNCLTTNAWHGKPLTMKQYVSQLFDPYNYLHYQDLIRKIVTPVKSESNKIIGPRDLHLTQSDILCPYSTPDGKKVGLVKQPSVHAYISIERRNISQMVFDILNTLPKYYSADEPLSCDNTIILVNGVWICCILIKYLAESDGGKRNLISHARHRF